MVDSPFKQYTSLWLTVPLNSIRHYEILAMFVKSMTVWLLIDSRNIYLLDWLCILSGRISAGEGRTTLSFSLRDTGFPTDRSSAHEPYPETDQLRDLWSVLLFVLFPCQRTGFSCASSTLSHLQDSGLFRSRGFKFRGWNCFQGCLRY